MYLHFDPDILKQDFEALLDSFRKVALGYDKHKTLAKRLRDPSKTERTQATITIIANCSDCDETVRRDLTTIWQLGSPIHVSLNDGTCPYCGSKKGFHYGSTHSLHA
jgi:rubrerythrin